MKNYLQISILLPLVVVTSSIASAFIARPAIVKTAIAATNGCTASPTILQMSSSSSTGEETEAERLLRKARELREQAQQQEQQVHSELTKKKQEQNKHSDDLIDFLFTNSDKTSPTQVLERLKQKKVSMATLEKIVDRLNDRHILASGFEHVEMKQDDSSGVDFERIKSKRDDQEVQRLGNIIDILLEAVAKLDDEFRQVHLQKKTGGIAGESEGSLLYSVTAVEADHWGGGQASKHLKARLQEKQRERNEQFQKRQKEFYDAQTIKKDKNKPPPKKVKDDHGFL